MKINCACAIAVGSLVLATQAQGVDIWAYNNLVAAGTANNLIHFDSATPGTVISVGSSGQNGTLFSGLDFTPNGNLYAYGIATGSVPSGLMSVNTATGAATLIGGGGIGAGENVNDMSYNPVTGQMLAVTSGSSTGFNNLYTLNLATGAATLLGPIAGLQGMLDVGLASNAAGVNFVHDIVSLAGLVATPMGPEGILTNFSQGMTIDWSGSGTWYHAAVVNSPTTFISLYTVNSGSGAATLVGSIGAGPTSFEPGDIAIRPVPAPAGVALLGLGGLVIGRRRR